MRVGAGHGRVPLISTWYKYKYKHGMQPDQNLYLGILADSTHLALPVERIHGGFPAAGIRGVDDVIVDQGGRVDHLRDLGYLQLGLE